MLLFVGKFLLGTLTGSVAITADAVNNLSDASSSVVTLLGFRLAAKPADAGHPFGHHRIEYLAGLAVAAMILLIGADGKDVHRQDPPPGGRRMYGSDDPRAVGIDPGEALAGTLQPGTR